MCQLTEFNLILQKVPVRSRIWKSRSAKGLNIYSAPDNHFSLHVLCSFVDSLKRAEMLNQYTSYFSVFHSHKEKQIHKKQTSKYQFTSASSHNLSCKDYCSNGKPYAWNYFKSVSHMFRFTVLWMVIWPQAMHWNWSFNLWWPWLGVGSSQGQCLMPG